MKELSDVGSSSRLIRQVTGEVMSTFASDTDHIIKKMLLKVAILLLLQFTSSPSKFKMLPFSPQTVVGVAAI